MNQTEAHRLTAAVCALRPDWPLASVSGWIAKNLLDRPYRDAAVALTWVATDPETKTPARVLEAGPWWRAVVAGGEATVSAITTMCGEHPSERALNCRQCEADAQTADHATGAAAVLDALRAAPRLPRPTAPPGRPDTDLTAARTHIDQGETRE